MALLRAIAAYSLTLAVLAIAGPLSYLAHAGETWDGNGVDDDWSTNNNWTPNGEPPNDGTANIVMAGTNRLTPNVDVDWDIRSLVFSNTAGAFALDGGSGVSLGVGEGGIVNQDTQRQIVLVPVDLNASQTWSASQGQLNVVGAVTGHPIIPRTLTLSGANPMQISGAVTGAVTVNKTGSGTLTFNSVTTNTYSGPTTVSAGTLALERGGGPNRAIPGNLNIGDGFGGAGSDIVRLDASDQISEGAGNTVTVNSSGLFNLNGFNETVQNLTLNSGSISGAGTLTLHGSIASGASSASASISALVDFGGGTRTINVADGAAAVDLNVSSLITNGALTKTGAGVLRLSYVGSDGGFPNPHAYQGDTIVNEGTLELSHPVEFGQLPTILGNVTIGDGVGLDTLRVTNTHPPFDNDFVRVAVNSSGLLDLNASLNPAVRFLDLVGGSVTTGNATLFTYGLHVHPSTQSATFSGRLNTGGFILEEGLIVDDGTPVDDLLFDGSLQDIDKTGAGRVRLIGDTGSVYGESFILHEGTIVLDRTTAGVGIGSIRVLGGSLMLARSEQIGAYTSDLNPDNLLSVEGAAASFDLAGFNETINDLKVANQGAVVTGGGALTMRNLTLQGGALNPSSGMMTINGTVSSLASSLDSLLGGNVNMAATDRSFDVGNGAAAIDLEVTLPLNGTNSLSKTGAGTLLLSGATNGYTGLTTVSAGVLLLGKSAADGAVPADLTATGGTVRLSANEQITATGTVTLNGGSLLDLNGFTETIGNLSLHGGAVAMGAGTLVVTGDITQAASAASSIAGRLDLGGAARTIFVGDVPVTAVDLDISAEVINGSFIKQGAGALRLGGNNAFAGGVNHKFGKLLVGHDNALGTGALSLDGGAMEADGGARSLSNPIVVASLSTVSGPEALTFNGSFATNLGAALTKSGTGALTIAGPQAHASGAALFATAGVVNFDSGAPGGTLNVNLSNAGTLVNFNADQDLNTLVVNGGRARVGNATLLGANSLSVGADAELELELGGLIAGSEHAKLVMSNHASLAGTMEITLTGGFTPQAGDVFDVLDWGSVSGSFSAINLPPLDGSATWDASSLYTTGVLSVRPAYEADFDLDGDVDGDDLTQWVGDFGVNDLSDADNDGDSDGADFLAWQRQLGSVPIVPAAGAVPEPEAILLLAMATAALWGRWPPSRRGEQTEFPAAR